MLVPGEAVSANFFFLYGSIAFWTLAVFQFLNPIHNR
jgi:hypothetical protein